MITAEKPFPTVAIKTTGKLRTCGSTGGGGIFTGSGIGACGGGAATTGSGWGGGFHTGGDIGDGGGTTTGAGGGGQHGGDSNQGPDAGKSPRTPPTAGIPLSQPTGPLSGSTPPRKKELSLEPPELPPEVELPPPGFGLFLPGKPSPGTPVEPLLPFGPVGPVEPVVPVEPVGGVFLTQVQAWAWGTSIPGTTPSTTGKRSGMAAGAILEKDAACPEGRPSTLSRELFVFALTANSFP